MAMAGVAPPFPKFGHGEPSGGTIDLEFGNPACATLHRFTDHRIWPNPVIYDLGAFQHGEAMDTV